MVCTKKDPIESLECCTSLGLLPDFLTVKYTLKLLMGSQVGSSEAQSDRFRSAFQEQREIDIWIYSLKARFDYQASFYACYFTGDACSSRS